MRAGRPRSQEGESQKPSGQAKADAVGGHRAGGSIFFIMNIDRQDEQDEQDERFLHEKLAQPMTRCGLAAAQECGLAVS